MHYAVDIFMLSVAIEFNTECRLAEYHFAECRLTECRLAKCRLAKCRLAEYHFDECYSIKLILLGRMQLR